jgi:hypothetical protein
MAVACRHRHLSLPRLLHSILPPVVVSPTPSHDKFDDSPERRVDVAALPYCLVLGQSTYFLSLALLYVAKKFFWYSYHFENTRYYYLTFMLLSLIYIYGLV